MLSHEPNLHNPPEQNQILRVTSLLQRVQTQFQTVRCNTLSTQWTQTKKYHCSRQNQNQYPLTDCPTYTPCLPQQSPPILHVAIQSTSATHISTPKKLSIMSATKYGTTAPFIPVTPPVTTLSKEHLTKPRMPPYHMKNFAAQSFIQQVEQLSPNTKR